MVIEKILLGITLAAPIGPVSLEIIRRGLTSGFIAAFLVCAGAIVGDGLCLGAAYLGLSKLTTHQYVMNVLGLLGALFLLYLGITNIKDRNKDFHFEKKAGHDGIVKSMILGFALAVVNPLSLVFWVSIFAASTADIEHMTFLPNALILLGVLIWGVFLCGILSVTKNLLNKNLIKTIILLSSLLLISYGCKYAYAAGVNFLSI